MKKMIPANKAQQRHRSSQETLKGGLKNQFQSVKISATKDVVYWSDKIGFIVFGFIIDLLLLQPCSPRCYSSPLP